MSLVIKNLKVTTAGNKSILKDVNLTVEEGQIVVLEGQNGSGKSTLARALAGDRELLVTGEICLDLKGLSHLPADKRCSAGLFLSFQNPVELPNITVASFLKAIYWSNERAAQTVEEFAEKLEKYLHLLKLPVEVLSRNVNQNFSGGEKKRLELLQMLLLEPKYAVLDEVDSGVDKQSADLLIRAIEVCRQNFNTGFLVITHYQKFLDLLNPSRRLLLKEGNIVILSETKDLDSSRDVQNDGVEA